MEKRKEFKDESRCTPFAFFFRAAKVDPLIGLYLFLILFKKKLIEEPGLGILRDDSFAKKKCFVFSCRQILGVV